MQNTIHGALPDVKLILLLCSAYFCNNIAQFADFVILLRIGPLPRNNITRIAAKFYFVFQLKNTVKFRFLPIYLSATTETGGGSPFLD